MNSRLKTGPAKAVSRSFVRARKGDILLVGLSSEEARTVPSRLIGALASDMVEIGLDGLDDDRLSEAMAILSPVVGRGFDAVDLAERLKLNGFSGRYIAFATEIADADMIRREVQTIAPGLSFAIVTMGHGPRLAFGETQAH